MPLIYRDAYLELFPPKIEQNSRHVSLGDLHGNALKLLYILLEEGVLELNKAQYDELYAIYTTAPAALTKEQLERFRTIIESAHVNLEKSVTLIGDELADRGNNDYFTLLILKKLHHSKLKMDIILSNHSAEFIKDYSNKEFTGRSNLGRGQGNSLAMMRELIKKGLVNENEVREIVEKCYKPMLKAISYTISPEGGLTLFTHAPVGLETIQALAKKFHIPYNDKTPLLLIQTIDKINEKIRNAFTRNELKQLLIEEKSAGSTKAISVNFPLKRLIWNRIVGDELITKTSSGIKINFVHGHVGDKRIQKNGAILSSHENLDSSWGKFPELYNTGFNIDFEMNVRHFTRHSNDVTHIKELDGAFIWRNLLKFEDLFRDFQKETKHIILKGTEGTAQFNPKYKKAAEVLQELYKEITAANELFLQKSLSSDSIKTFLTSMHSSITVANKELRKHRGIWHGKNPLIDFLKAIVGMIFLLPLGLPALAVQLGTKQGFINSFFSTPTTASSHRLNTFEKELQQIIDPLEEDLNKPNLS